MEETIRNKVDESGLVQLDLEQLLPQPAVVGLDLAAFLEEGFILREKAFRQHVKTLQLAPFKDKYVALFCSTDAIIPLWSWMLLSMHLAEVANDVFQGEEEDVRKRIRLQSLDALDVETYKDARVIVKGCSDDIPEEAYVRLSRKLKPVVKTLMFGEACSAVPLYKQPRQKP